MFSVKNMNINKKSVESLKNGLLSHHSYSGANQIKNILENKVKSIGFLNVEAYVCEKNNQPKAILLDIDSQEDIVYGDGDAIKFLLIELMKYKKTREMGPIDLTHRNILHKIGHVTYLDEEAVSVSLTLNNKSKQEMKNSLRELTDGMYLDTPRIEDAKRMKEIMDEAQQYEISFIENVIIHQQSCVIRNNQDQVIAYAFIRPTGCIGMLNVDPKYRRKGLAENVVFGLIDRVFNEEEKEFKMYNEGDDEEFSCEFFAEINSENAASRGLFDKLGFKQDKEKMIWVILDLDLSGMHQSPHLKNLHTKMHSSPHFRSRGSFERNKGSNNT